MGASERNSYLNILVNGEEIEIDIDDELAINDIDTDMKKTSSEIAYWGTILANAEEEKLLSEAYYRRWKANLGEQYLADEPKLAEWKIKQRIESSEQFEVLKKAIAKASGNIIRAKSMFEAYCKKSNMLQSKGAMLRHELSADGMSVRIDEEDKIKAMKSSFKKKGKRNG